MKKKEIILAWTRDFTLTWAEWWSRDMNPRLVEVFGTGAPNQLSYYNGRLLETYRLADEAKGFIEAVVKADLKLLGKEKIDRYVAVVAEVRKLIKEVQEKKTFTNASVFEKLKVLSREMYPWYTVSYLLPQEQWAGKLTEKYPVEAPNILKQLLYARKQSEGAIEELVEYWRSVAERLLAERKFSSRYASFVTFSELERMLGDGKFIPKVKELESRSKSYIFFGDSVYTGITMELFFEKHGLSYSPTATDTTVHEFRGVVSSKGSSSIRGVVQVVMRNDEVAGFKEGNILVTVMTNPFFIPAMKKAAAILTDEGGVTCHAAIVARELGVPCIIGTKIATKVLRDGMMVEVDANTGIVKILSDI